ATAAAFGVAWLAIVGVPPFSGFFAKDDVLAKAFFAHRYGLWAVGLLAAFLTGAYMTRQFLLVFSGNERFRAAAAEGTSPAPEGGDLEREVHGTSPTVGFGTPPSPPPLTHDPHEAPRVMTAPVVTLAVLAAAGGLLDVPLRGVDFLDRW